MRVFSVDTKSLFFFVKMLFFVSFFVVLWNVFVPTQHFLFSRNVENEKVHTANISQDKEVEPASDVPSALAHQGKYVVVDMTNKSVTTYDSEYVVESFEVLSVPSNISPLVLPEGAYAVTEKGTAEVSAVGMVRFPYAVTFSDMYIMHGTPTDAEGVPLEEGYVGGQIELALEDAVRVYEFVDVGTPIYILALSVTDEKKAPTTLKVQYEELPAVSAQAYALTDVSTGQTFLSKNSNERYPIASITKFVTAAVATDVIGHGTEVLAPDGEYYTLSDLYYPLLLRSDNKVAKNIALHAGEHYFMGNMNAYVKALGMEHTSFYDSSGLSPKNISTALDLSTFARHLYEKKRFIFEISNEKSVTITSTQGVDWNMKNQNTLVSDPYFYGGKLGYTDEAGQTALSLFTVPIAGEVRVLSVVVLNSKDWKQDTRTLVRWLEEHTEE